MTNPITKLIAQKEGRKERESETEERSRGCLEQPIVLSMEFKLNCEN